jgi:hypothetical protein
MKTLFKNELLMETVLRDEHSKEIIFELQNRYFDDYPNEIPEVIKQNNNLMEIYTLSLQKENTKIENALEWEVCQNYKNKNFKINDNYSFIVALKSCQILCPDGNYFGQSELVKRYFKNMVQYLRDHELEYVNTDWSRMYNTNDYMVFILNKEKQNEKNNKE